MNKKWYRALLVSVIGSVALVIVFFCAKYPFQAKQYERFDQFMYATYNSTTDYLMTIAAICFGASFILLLFKKYRHIGTGLMIASFIILFLSTFVWASYDD